MLFTNRQFSAIHFVVASVFFSTLTLASTSSVPWDSYITQDQLSQLSEAERKGLEIAIQEDQRDIGWNDSQSNMTMVIRSKSGAESLREITFKSLEVVGGGDKSLSVFRTPRDLNGTAFLSYSHISDPDDQWIYLASIKRVKRINSNNKSGPYMGSEFAFEDLSSFEVNKYDFTFLREDKLNGIDCYVVERIPRDKKSGYKKIISWIDKEHYRRLKVDFYDRKGELLKTLNRTDYELFLKRIWRAKTLTMHNHQTGKSTVLKFSDMEFNVGLSESNFDKQTLARMR